MCVPVLQDVTWNLQVQKTGTDTVYQGAVTGQVTITNPQATPVTVYNINSYVQGGPSATVSCGTQLPFQVCLHGCCLVFSRHSCSSVDKHCSSCSSWLVGHALMDLLLFLLCFAVMRTAPAIPHLRLTLLCLPGCLCCSPCLLSHLQIPPCSSSVCNYVGYWPLAPAAGSYTGLADVSYTVGDAGAIGNQVGTAAFQVGTLSPAVGVLNTANGLQVPSGQALVQDAMAPQQYFFSASAQQSYTTQLSCPETAIVTNQATLTAATGQTISQTATVQKLCYDLQVRVAQAASPFVGKWNWAVTKEASVGSMKLKPSATAWDKYVKQQMDLAIASGQDPQAAMELITGGVNSTALSASTMDGSMTGEVTYKVCVFVCGGRGKCLLESGFACRSGCADAGIGNRLYAVCCALNTFCWKHRHPDFTCCCPMLLAGDLHPHAPRRHRGWRRGLPGCWRRFHH